MRTLKLTVIACILMLFFATEEVIAQRRMVIKTPYRTVIRTSGPRVIYPVPVARSVRFLPGPAVVVKHSGLSYYYCGGLYYRYYRGRYVVAAAPTGIRVSVLPVGYTRIVVQGRPYFYSQGNYYIQIENGYKTVSAPKNIVATELPEERNKGVVSNTILNSS